MRWDTFVSIVVPLDDDADILPAAVAEIDAAMRQNFADYEMIFVDDGSTDGTRSFFERVKATTPCFRYFRLTRRFGREMAIACGLEQAIGDVIVVFCPATDPPGRIADFVAKALDTNGIVVGVSKDKSRRSLAYRAAFHAYHGACRLLLPRAQVEGATHFIALTRTALNALLKIKDNARYVRVLAMYAGFEVTKAPYEFAHRRQPARRRRPLPLLIDGVQLIVTNSERPLRAAAIVSVAIGFFDFAFLAYVLAMRFFLPDVAPGWASTNFFNAVMFGVMFFVLAVLCEYLAQTRSELKRRPLYVIQDEMQSNVMPSGGSEKNVVGHEEVAVPQPAGARAALPG
jgi:polyisoprenyl-phosphate glycosyltransferase